MLKFWYWAIENRRANIGWVRNYSGPIPKPRGHKLKDQFLKIVDKKKLLRKAISKVCRHF